MEFNFFLKRGEIRVAELVLLLLRISVGNDVDGVRGKIYRVNKFNEN